MLQVPYFPLIVKTVCHEYCMFKIVNPALWKPAHLRLAQL